MGKQLLIFGTGDLAKLMHFYFTHDSAYEVAAFTVNKQYMQQTTFLGLPVIAFEEIENVYPSAQYVMFIAVGYSNMRNRKRVYELVQEKGYQLTNYRSSKAIIYHDLELGNNNVIMGNVHIEPFVRIGHNNILWSDVLVCHNTEIGNHNFISAKSQIGGFSKIGDLSFLGFNCTVVQHITIADESLIGAKSLVLESTAAYGKYIGIPARKVDEHRESGIAVS